MSVEKQGNPLEQFVLLAKSAKGVAAVELIKQTLESPNVYVFGELLDMPNIKELTEGPHANYHSLLNLFAFGNYADYKENQATLPELSAPMLKKLRHLSVVSLATKNKCLPYTLLLKELDIRSLRELEDLIIEVVYADIVRGKLDQNRQLLEVDYAIGRDIRPEQISELSKVLQDWCSGCEAILAGIETQIGKANTYKEKSVKIKSDVETEVQNIKKTLKTTQQSDIEDQMVTDSTPTTSEKPAKKASKSKGLRGSGKLWGKSS